MTKPALNWKTFALPALGFVLYPILLAFPYPFFRYHARAENIAVFSDESISPALFPILNDVERRLQRSPLNDTSLRHRVFICNETWLFVLLATTDYHAGGVNKAWLNQSIFLRRANIPGDRLLGPSGKEVAGDRTLAYFITHEIVHTLEERHLDRYGYLRLPAWKTEGYADYVARDSSFVLAERLRAFHQNSYEMDPARSGLYFRYQLFVTFLLDEKRVTPQELLTRPIAATNIEQQLRTINLTVY